MQEHPQRRRTTVPVPKRSWAQRNPRVFAFSFITTSLLVLFSKPLYDIFIYDGEYAPPRSIGRRN